MNKKDWEIAFDAAIAALSKMLDDMRHGALDGCDPTQAANLAATTHEAIVAINGGVSILERESAK